jgi:hypothetical protein
VANRCFPRATFRSLKNVRTAIPIGAYHSGDPAGPVDESMLSGCALAVADKDDIEQVGWDDLVVFSVNHDCVKQRITPFEVCRLTRSTTTTGL